MGAAQIHGGTNNSKNISYLRKYTNSFVNFQNDNINFL